MADYKGFFTKGMASGLQSGVNMGMQLTQMKWQKKKQKELEDMTLKMNDTWNSIGQELITLANDGQLSEDDKLKVYTLTMAAPYEMQGVMQNLRSSLSQFDTKGFDSQMELVKTFYEYAQGMDTNDIDSLYETFRGYITNPHALTLFEVADKKLRHEYEVAQAQPTTEVFATAEAVQEAYPGQGYKYDTTAKGYVPTFREPEAPVAPTAPKTTDYNTAATYLSKFMNASPETFNKIKAGLQKNTGLDLSAITQESLREPEEAVTEKEVTPIAFKTLQDIKDSFKNVKTKAEYDSALQSYNASKEAKASDWTPPEFGDQLIDYIKKVEDAIWADYVNKEGKLKSKADAEEYNVNLQNYLDLIEEARKAGIDVSQFQAFIPYKALYYGAGNPLVTKESW